MEYITAFVTGGLICAAVQILLDRTKMMPGRVMVLLVCSGAVLGFAGLYKPFSGDGGLRGQCPAAGLRQSSLAGGAEAVDEHGLLGVFMGGFTASAAGIAAALIFGYIASLCIRSEDEEMMRCFKVMKITR